MVRRLVWLLTLCLAGLLVSAAAAPAPVQAASPIISPAYVLGPNDAVSVVVYGQSEFNVSTRVKPDGTIVMPLIGKVQAEGKTVITLADEIGRRLVQGNFLKDPIVNIEITEHASSYVRVIGKVGSPGMVPLDRSNRLMDCMDKINRAQGRGTMRYAGEGLGEQWRMRQRLKSAARTTGWAELPGVRA